MSLAQKGGIQADDGSYLNFFFKTDCSAWFIGSLEVENEAEQIPPHDGPNPGIPYELSVCKSVKTVKSHMI